ncbi:hypothetical protein AVEN_45888-1 [Araneus ventricosus]|uniref:Uncharacterized protein n=1 Tax=Araneus ventricosus TaxID=182803 RepID=A0A4Y2JZ03_ARAVE|nr:hypothetical protein AVEN_45888-1 [Araneus ventricosus]
MNYFPVICPQAGQTTEPQSCAFLHSVDWMRSLLTVGLYRLTLGWSVKSYRTPPLDPFRLVVVFFDDFNLDCRPEYSFKCTIYNPFLDVEYLGAFIKLAEFRQPERGVDLMTTLYFDIWSEYVAHCEQFQ